MRPTGRIMPAFLNSTTNIRNCTLVIDTHIDVLERRKTPTRLLLLKSHHFTYHDELRPQNPVNGEHAQNAKEKHHMIECEYNARRVETRGADGDGNESEYETSNVRDECDDVKKIPQIRRVAQKFEPHTWRVIHCNLHKE